MPSLADLFALLAVPAIVVPATYLARTLAQTARDRHRHVYRLGFPRSLTDRQATAFLATLAGLATPKATLLGRDAAVLEVVATGGRVEHFLRLPAASRRYFVAQLRAAVPGIEIVEEVSPHLPRLDMAQELRRVGADRPLAIPDSKATAAAVLTAASGAGRGALAVWQVVVTGGAPGHPVPSWRAIILSAFMKPKNATKPSTALKNDGMVFTSLRVGAAGGHMGVRERVARLRRAAGSVSVPGGRLVPRALPNVVVSRRLSRGATPVTSGATPLTLSELTALVGWPLFAPAVPGLRLGRSPQLAPSSEVPRTERVLGDSTTEPVRPVAVRAAASPLHLFAAGPTGSGKSWLAAGLALQDIAAGRGVTIIDPKGSLVRSVAARLPVEALERVVWVDPTDESRPVPLPLLSPDAPGYTELAADTLIGLLRHRFSDLGPRSGDIVTSSLYTLARVPGATLLDLLRLWSDTGYRQAAVAQVSGDPALASFWASYEAASPGERAFWLAAPTNKIRPLLQRAAVRNVIAAPRATFTFTEALAKDLIVFVSLPAGELGADASGLIGQVVLARLWAAVQSRRTRRPYLVTIDEAHRFLDQPTDLGDVLAMSREYGVGYQLLTQSPQQLPERLRDIVMNSARTKVAFQTSARDATRLAAEFGPLVSADMLAGLGEYEAIAVVATGGAVSEPFTLRTRPLGDPIPGRAVEVRRASRERYGIPRTEIEASFKRAATPRADEGEAGGLGPVGRRPRS